MLRVEPEVFTISLIIGKKLEFMLVTGLIPLLKTVIFIVLILTLIFLYIIDFDLSIFLNA